MVVGSCDRCFALSLIIGECKRSLLPALRRLTVNQLWLLQCPGFRSSSLPGSKASTKIQVIFSMLSIQEYTPCTRLTIPLDQTHLIEAALHLRSQAPPSSPLAAHLLTP
ncbi:hypothetical protein CRENBAI_006040 [Crenichthys baileyi]|uniref:Uncharacterized protein n=1 Tax=Crenichthys baileyi TaxID=28760 RepID=A0AAV9RMT3_9TELE